MGLDMYLEKKLYIYSSQRSTAKVDVNELLQLKNKEGLISPGDMIDLSKVKKITLEIAYWRKNYHIHQWFVENIQDGKDDCEEYEVAVDQLQELIDTCKIILAHPEKAEELMPNIEDSPFGKREYDEWYFEGLKYTIEALEAELANHGETENWWYYTYQSSW